MTMTSHGTFPSVSKEEVEIGSRNPSGNHVVTPTSSPDPRNDKFDTLV